jgi:hypothetical protein
MFFWKNENKERGGGGEFQTGPMTLFDNPFSSSMRGFYLFLLLLLLLFFVSDSKKLLM